MKKKAIGLVLTAAVVMNTAAFAEGVRGVNLKNAAPIVTSAQKASSFVQGILTVTEVGDEYIVGKTEEGTRLQLNLSEETILIDSKKAAAFDIDDIDKGDTIYAEYSSITTRSIPAQSTASLIAANIEKGGGVNLINVSEITKDKDGNVTVYDEEKDLFLTIAEDATVKPYKTRNIVRLSDIVEGTTLIAWYDTVSLSLPAQAYTEKVVVTAIPEVEEPEIDKDETKKDDEDKKNDGFTIVIGGKELDLSNLPYYDGDTLMVPLRKIGEALGYKIGWDEKTGAITIEKENDRKATLFNGIKDVIFRGKKDNKDNRFENKSKTVIKDGCTYVPLDFFNEFSNDTSIKGRTIKVAPGMHHVR